MVESDAVGGPVSPVSPDVAAAAWNRYERFREAGGPGEVLFDSGELTSMVRFLGMDRLPDALTDVEFTIAEGRIDARMRLAVDQVASFPDLSEFQALLSDTVTLRMEGTIIPSRGTGAAILIERVELGRVPLPRRVIPRILAALGREAAPGLPEEAIEVPLPVGIGSAYIDGDHLVLTGQEE